MFYKRLQLIYCTYLLLLEIRCLHAQKGTSAHVKEVDGVPNLLKSRFLEPVNMGIPDFAPSFGNLGSNYPSSQFFPFSNQFRNFYLSRPNYGWSFENQDPNFRGPQQDQNQGNFRGLFRAGPNSIYDPTGHDMNTNQIHSFVPNDGPMLHVNRPYENGQSSFQPRNTEPENPIHDDYYRPASNYIPDTRPQFLIRPINYPMENTQQPGDNGIHQYQNQYPAENYFPSLGNQNPRTGSNGNTQPPYTSHFQNIKNPQNDQRGTDGKQKVHSLNQIPINEATGNSGGSNFKQGHFNGPRQNMPSQKLPHADSGKADSDRKVAILGKPVILPPPETAKPSDVDEESLKKAAKKQCVQDCDTTSEYYPICGTDYVTYINPEKFTCARNCGVDVNISRYGRCSDDPASDFALVN